MNKFNYNEQLATQIGAGQYVTKSGGYDLKIVRSQFTKSNNNNAEFLELDFETREGLKLNYVSINFVNGKGEENAFGMKMINAIMGCANVQNLTQANDGSCPELFNKGIKAVVQRVDYTKQSGQNAGQDGYKFELKLPANIGTGRTVKETSTNATATAFDQYASSIEDKDERTAPQANQQSGGFNSQQAAPDVGDSFSDDIPF
tara:strand:- start:1113 stop:1721 length:609 start_codon:yes stop_codon:yes gene_type:complete